MLWYFDDHSDAPIEGVRVMVGDDPDTALTGTTDAGGRVVFEDPSLIGPLNIHSLGDGYPAASVFGLDATFATFTPEIMGWEADAPTAVIGGAVTGLPLIPTPGAGEMKFAMVFFGQPLEDGYSGDYPAIEQATVDDIPVNAIIPAIAKTSYTLEVYDRIGTLFVVGGIRNPAAQTFDATHLGIVRGFDPGAAEGDVDLALAVPLPNTFGIEIDPLAGGYGAIRATAVLDFGEDGTVSWSGNLVDGPVASVATPDLSSGPLADAGIMIAAVAQQPYDADAEEWETYPRGRRLVRDLPDLDDNTGTPLLVGDLVAGPSDLLWSGGLEATWPAAAYGRVEVTDADGLDVWIANLFGEPLEQVPVPDLPADWSWPGIPASIEILATASVLDADLNEMAFDDFPYLMDASADAMILFTE